MGHDRAEAEGEHNIFGDGGEFVLMAGACYTRKTLENPQPPPGFVDQPEAMMSTLREVRALHHRAAQLFYGHELWAHLDDEPVKEATPLRLAAATAAARPGWSLPIA
ncbi:MAG: hypothetical protein WC816_15745 [Sphingomonas sp.]|jgi:hypothetical protein